MQVFTFIRLKVFLDNFWHWECIRQRCTRDFCRLLDVVSKRNSYIFQVKASILCGDSYRTKPFTLSRNRSKLYHNATELSSLLRLRIAHGDAHILDSQLCRRLASLMCVETRQGSTHISEVDLILSEVPTKKGGRKYSCAQLWIFDGNRPVCIETDKCYFPRWRCYQT